MCLDGTRISCVLTHGKRDHYSPNPLLIVVNKLLRALSAVSLASFDPYLSTSLSNAMHLIPQAQKQLASITKPSSSPAPISISVDSCSYTSALTSMDTAKSLILCTVLAAGLALSAADWSQGTATNYGGADGSGTMGKQLPY